MTGVRRKSEWRMTNGSPGPVASLAAGFSRWSRSFFRPNGAEIIQPRATPWATRLPQTTSALKGQNNNRERTSTCHMFRPFRAENLVVALPRALPWAGLFSGPSGRPNGSFVNVTGRTSGATLWFLIRAAFTICHSTCVLICAPGGGTRPTRRQSGTHTSARSRSARGARRAR